MLILFHLQVKMSWIVICVPVIQNSNATPVSAFQFSGAVTIKKIARMAKMKRDARIARPCGC